MVQEGVQQPWTGVCVLSCFSHVWLFVTLWTTAHQAPLSMGFLRKNTGVGCHALLQGISLTQELNLGLLHWQADSSPLSHLGSPPLTRILLNCKVISYAFFFLRLWLYLKFLHLCLFNDFTCQFCTLTRFMLLKQTYYNNIAIQKRIWWNCWER